MPPPPKKGPVRSDGWAPNRPEQAPPPGFLHQLLSVFFAAMVMLGEWLRALTQVWQGHRHCDDLFQRFLFLTMAFKNKMQVSTPLISQNETFFFFLFFFVNGWMLRMNSGVLPPEERICCLVSGYCIIAVLHWDGHCLQVSFDQQ